MKRGDEDKVKSQSRADALAAFYRRQKRMPSYSEMAQLFQLRSKNAVAKVVTKFEAQGLLTRDAKGYLLPGTALSSVRIIGTVEAGFPSPAEEELGDNLSLDEFLIQNRSATFLLTVTGDSMVEAGIMPGDIVIVDRSLEAKTNDVVIATVDGQWTMKYFCKEKGRVFLLAANPKYKPIVPQREMTIHGVVTSVLRKYR